MLHFDTRIHRRSLNSNTKRAAVSDKSVQEFPEMVTRWQAGPPWKAQLARDPGRETAWSGQVPEPWSTCWTGPGPLYLPWQVALLGLRPILAP